MRQGNAKGSGAGIFASGPGVIIPDQRHPTLVFPPSGSGMDLDRDTIASAIVGTGGAWLLGSAVLHGHGGRWNRAQVRGLIFAGVGFLTTAVAARWLQSYGNRGIAVSMVGTMLAMRGMYILVKERVARRDVDRRDAEREARRAAKPRPPE